jgi:sulfatase maturation enzyme AslB (radical SAM superfamily)
MNSTPICLAPWKSILIDTNKDLKPCCAYERGDLGNLNNTSIQEILSGPAWTDVKHKLTNQEWPQGCAVGCKEREEKIKYSVRLSYQKNYIFSNDEKINYLEFNGSNICNLACLHCSPKFSSKWLTEWKKLEKILPGGMLDPAKNEKSSSEFLTNSKLVLKNLKELDLSDLRNVAFKGGDPMLNDETLIAIKHFEDISILDKLEIQIITNGTIINEELLQLLNKAKKVLITVSVDGVGKLNEYIRYGSNTNSNTEQLKKNIEIFASFIKNIELTFSVSVMVYNIFNLLEIKKLWTLELSKYNNFIPAFFSIIVIDPMYLNPCVLSNETRLKLVDFYKQHQVRDEFEIVINSLSGEYLGDKIHNDWVRYTNEMELLRSNSILELVPELTEELQYR